MLDFITVVYRQELPLLKIQARSIDLYVKSQNINSIVVVVNDNTDVNNLIDASWYGQHQTKLKIINFPSTSLIGWDSQQLYKLLAASQSQSQWSMILDAKTWFIQDLNIAKILDDSSRAYQCPLENFGSFKNEFKFVQDFFSIDANNTVLGPAGVPYMFHNKTVQSLINSIENITGIEFNQWFIDHVCDPPRITEFMLYSVYVLYKYGNYHTIYSRLDQPNYFFYNVCDWEVLKFDKIYSQIIDNISNVLTVSVHRRAYNMLQEQQKQTWIEFLKDKQLLNQEADINTLY